MTFHSALSAMSSTIVRKPSHPQPTSIREEAEETEENFLCKISCSSALVEELESKGTEQRRQNEHYLQKTDSFNSVTLLRFPSRATRSCELEISAVTAAQSDAQEEDVRFFSETWGCSSSEKIAGTLFFVLSDKQLCRLKWYYHDFLSTNPNCSPNGPSISRV